jgi:hypothetical protein
LNLTASGVVQVTIPDYLKGQTMNQVRLEKAVARATGESLQEVRRQGFNIADPLDQGFDHESPDRPPLVVDWDQLEAQRATIFP